MRPIFVGKFLKKLRHYMTCWISALRINFYRLMGVEIGKNCFLSLRARIDVQGGRIFIGNNVHIAGGSFILGHTGFRPVTESDVTIIEDNVRIFVNAVILPGVRVGKNSIVGAGAVVMKDVPPNVIIQGNPARVIQHLNNNV